MKTKNPWRRRYFPKTTSKMAVWAVFAIMTLLYVPFVQADMPADTEILNVVTVTYYDASGTYDFSATAAATVTVTLVEAGVTISGRPTPTQNGDTADPPSDQNLQSGQSYPYLYAITSNANGDDSYDITISDTADAILTSPSVTSQIVGPDGTTYLQDSTDPLVLGASVIVDVSGTTLSFPGGTLTGIADGDVVVINGVDYLVGSVTYGSAASYDAGTGATTPEVRASFELSQNTNGSQVDPSSTTFSIGTPVYEQALLLVEVTAINTDPSDGDILVDVTVEPDSGGYSTAVDDQTTTFYGLSLVIEKLVRNVTAGDAVYTPAASAQGVTGEVLEYQVTVTNNGGNAALVVIDDTVPVYTTLVGDSAYTSGFAYFIFTDGAASTTEGPITMATGTEYADMVSGTAPDTVAGSALTFYVGQGHDGTAGTEQGGTLLNGESIVVRYQVAID